TLPFTTTTMPASGGSGSIPITAAADCSWTARSEAEWITITGGATGTGPRMVSFSVSANGAITARTGSVFLGGRRLTVIQDATPCTYSIWPGTTTWAAGGGSGGIDISTQPGCGWWVTTHAGWVHLANQEGSGVSGSGSGTLWYTVDANPNVSPR